MLSSGKDESSLISEFKIEMSDEQVITINTLELVKFYHNILRFEIS